jgi:RecB family exonuclease
MEPFVAQLSEICRAWPTRAKWVFVPTHAVGRTLGDRLVLAGVEWANLRFVTPLDVAIEMGAPFLVERGVDPSEEGLGPALVMRLLFGLSGEHAYFRPLADQPRMAAALWSTLKELRLAGVRSTDLPAGGFESAAKHRELVALVEAYERYLAEHARGDRATVIEEALGHPDWCPMQPDDCWTELPDVVWPPLERRLMDAMPGERLMPRTFALPGLGPPRRLATAAADRVRPAPDNWLGLLTLPPGHSDRTVGSRISLFHAGGSEAEIDEVFRRILAAGVSLDECEVVSASPDLAPLVWEKALRYDWPVTIAQGIPAALTRPGRALVAFGEWIEDDFAAGRLRRLLESGDVRLGDDVEVSAGRAARLLVQAEAAWGRDTYRLALGRLAASARRAAAGDDLEPAARAALGARADQADTLAAWIDALIASVPAPADDRRVDLQAVASAARVFIDRHAMRASALDHVAADALVDAIKELSALGPFQCALDHALRFLTERAEAVTVGADRPRPGHLHVSPLARAGLSGRWHVFVVGLEEGRVFPSAFDDPVLLDAERARASDALIRASDRPVEAVYTSLVRLAALTADAGVRVTLSYSCRDLREYRQTYASWVLLQAYRVLAGRPDATFRELHAHLGAPVSAVPAALTDAPDEGRAWLRLAARAGERARLPLFERYPSLEAGEHARRRRLSADFTEFDGHVPAAGPLLDPAAPGVVVSPTELEEAARCPFRHFLRRALGVDAIESGERDRDVWLTPLLRGSLLHDLYARLLRRCRDAGRRATVAVDGEWMRASGTSALAELAVEMPPPSAEIAERETALFLDDLALFIEAEEALEPGRTPIGLEVSFGRPDQTDGEPLAQAEPIVLDVGGLTLRVAGRIDRIDRTAPSTFEVVDYKTGGYWKEDWQGTFAGGTRLQHALYGLAAAELLRRSVDRNARVAAAEYYFSSAKGNQERKRIVTPADEVVGSVLADLRAVIASGVFVHAPEEASCRWCRHGLACGRRAHERAGAKLADAALAPFIRLTGHD